MISARSTLRITASPILWFALAARTSARTDGRSHPIVKRTLTIERGDEGVARIVVCRAPGRRAGANEALATARIRLEGGAIISLPASPSGTRSDGACVLLQARQPASALPADLYTVTPVVDAPWSPVGEPSGSSCADLSRHLEAARDGGFSAGGAPRPPGSPRR